jgi:hypothetical protein
MTGQRSNGLAQIANNPIFSSLQESPGIAARYTFRGLTCLTAHVFSTNVGPIDGIFQRKSTGKNWPTSDPSSNDFECLAGTKPRQPLGRI